MKHILKICFLYMMGTVMLFSSSLAQKYPSYVYVFHEFDIDEAYVYNDAFRDFVKTHEKQLTLFYQQALLRGREILPMMQGQLLQEGVSDLFIYLSMIESGFSTHIVSPKKAVGLWQFMSATAKHYNLTVCNSYDERCDAISATRAAIRYLNKLHKQFGRWYLAAMAYNCGEGCVQKAITKAGSNLFEILMDDRVHYLPRETRLYMKKILLIAMIGESRTLDFVPHKEEAFIQVDVAGGSSLKEIARLLNMDKERLLQLNQGIKNGILPSLKERYQITIPIEKIYAFYLRYTMRTPSKKEPKEVSNMITYRVKLGDTLDKIAQMYGRDKEELMRINHLKDEALLLDRLLVIPVSQEKFTNLSQ